MVIIGSRIEELSRLREEVVTHQGEQVLVVNSKIAPIEHHAKSYHVQRGYALGLLAGLLSEGEKLGDIPTRNYASKSFENIFFSGNEKWELKEGAIPTAQLNFLPLGREVEVVRSYPDSPTQEGSKLTVYVGNFLVETYFCSDQILFREFVSEFRNGEIDQERFKDLVGRTIAPEKLGEEFSTSQWDYAQALQLLGAEMPPFFKKAYEVAMVNQEAQVVRKLTDYAARNLATRAGIDYVLSAGISTPFQSGTIWEKDQNIIPILEKAITLGLHNSDKNLALGQGITVRLSDLVRSAYQHNIGPLNE